MVCDDLWRPSITLCAAENRGVIVPYQSHELELVNSSSLKLMSLNNFYLVVTYRLKLCIIGSFARKVASMQVFAGRLFCE